MPAVFVRPFRMSSIPRLLVFATLVLTGCKTVGEMPKVSDDARSVSLEPFEGVKVGGRSLENYATWRTAYLIAGVSLKERDITDDDEEVGLSGDITGDVAFGSAVAIDKRGYFATAAHCIGESGSELRIIFQVGKAMLVRKARIVYLGEGETDDSDFAIVHVAETLPNIFSWAETVEAGDRAMLVGAKNGDSEELDFNFEMVAAGGSVNEVVDFSPPNELFRQVRHTVPLNHGNSGGPLFRDDGRLLAINYGARGRLRPLRAPVVIYGGSIRPDLEWLRQMIDKDAAKHGN